MEYPAVPDNIKNWMNEQMWARLHHLKTVPGFNDVLDDLNNPKSIKLWRSWVEDDKAEKVRGGAGHGGAMRWCTNIMQHGKGVREFAVHCCETPRPLMTLMPLHPCSLQASMPGKIDQKTPFQKMCILRAMRPDRITDALTDW